MLASLWNPKVQRGGTWNISIEAVDDNDNPRDWSGYDSMRLVVRPAWVGKPGTVKSDPLFEISSTTGEIDFETTPNVITITVTPDITAALTFNSGALEFEMVIDEVDENNPEIIDKLMYGTMHVTGEIIV